MADRLIRCTALDVCTFTQLVIRGQARSVHFSPMSLVDVTEQIQKAKRQKLKRTRDCHVAALVAARIRITPARAVTQHGPQDRQQFACECDDRNSPSRCDAATHASRMPSPSRYADTPSMPPRSACRARGLARAGDLAHTLHRAALELLGHQSGIGADLAAILEPVRIIQVIDDRLGQSRPHARHRLQALYALIGQRIEPLVDDTKLRIE